jgi:hypothetical protein
MIDEAQPAPAQFVLVEGDQLIYCEGRLAWYFRIENNLYWVTRPEFFVKLPTWETLVQYRIQDRHRLWQWLADPGRQYHPTPVWGTTSPHWTNNGFSPTPVEPLNRPIYWERTPPAPRVEVSIPIETPRQRQERQREEHQRVRRAEQYDPEIYEEAASERERYEKARQKRADRLNKERRATERRIAGKAFIPTGRKHRKPPSEFKSRGFHPCGSGIATFLADHQYIEAMFELYSQQRYRLL